MEENRGVSEVFVARNDKEGVNRLDGTVGLARYKGWVLLGALSCFLQMNEWF